MILAARPEIHHCIALVIVRNKHHVQWHLEHFGNLERIRCQYQWKPCQADHRGHMITGTRTIYALRTERTENLDAGMLEPDLFFGFT